MAAPKLSKSNSNKNVQQSKKPKLKNVLCTESQSWPKPSKEVEQSILSKLSEVLRKVPNLFKPLRSATKADQETKRKVRAQLDLGTNCVTRSLERDRLSCVLVSGKTTPTIGVDHIVAIARERGCPLLCLDALAATIAKVSKSKCFPVCIGFKKLLADAKADFVEVISLVQQNTQVKKHRPQPLQKTADKKRPTAKTLPESLRPVCLDANTDASVLADLKCIFTKAVVKAAENKMWTSKDKKQKKNKVQKRLKQHYHKWLHLQFESGKRTVTDYVGQGKIRLVLVVPQLVPVLMAEPPTSSLLALARNQDCPVVCVSNLATVLCANTTKALAVLGIKKESFLPMNMSSAFSPVVEKCLNFLRTMPVPAQDMDIGEEREAEVVMDEKIDEDEEEGGAEKEDYSFLYIMKKDSADLKEKASKQLEERAKSSSQQSFISLSGHDSRGADSSTSLGKRKNEKHRIPAHLKPKKMLLDVKDGSEAESKSPLAVKAGQTAHASTDASGFLSFNSSMEKSLVAQAMAVDEGEMTQDKQKSSAAGADVEKHGGETETISGSLFSISRAGDKKSLSVDANSGIVGQNNNKELTAEEMSHVTDVFSATDRPGRKETKKRHGQEGFLSFTYNEANIHTMVANPNRKKKKKGKK